MCCSYDASAFPSSFFLLLPVLEVLSEDDTVTDESLLHLLHGLVDLGEREGLNHGLDAVKAGELKHIHHVLAATDNGSSGGLLAENEILKRDVHDGAATGDADLDEFAIGLEEAEELAGIDLAGSAVKNEIQLVSGGGLATGDALPSDEMVGTELLGLGLLVGEDIDGGDITAHGMGELDGEMAKTTDTHNGDLHTEAVDVALKGSKDGDTGAEKGSGVLGLEGGRDLEQEISRETHHVLEATVVAQDNGPGVAGLADVLVTGKASQAATARVADPTSTDDIADLDVLDAGADGNDLTNDLVSGDERELGDAPIVEGHVEIGMAETVVGDADINLLGARDGRDGVLVLLKRGALGNGAHGPPSQKLGLVSSGRGLDDAAVRATENRKVASTATANGSVLSRGLGAGGASRNGGDVPLSRVNGGGLRNRKLHFS
mmetsp:Transcript_31428/g.57063  ORF Transcript_31428/g.57063 Transcript_31428/m.57063 type:complete len:433 (-) Transcript_31428:32-1330(-)